MTVPLSSLPTGTKFRTSDGIYTKCTPTDWDALRSNPDHWLHGISPQVARRADVHYVVQDGVLSLMQPDMLVEPVTVWDGQRYRLTVDRFGKREVFGVDTLEAVRVLIRLFGLAGNGFAVAIQDGGLHINADGTPCREQEKGLQFRAVEARVMIGSLNV